MLKNNDIFQAYFKLLLAFLQKIPQMTLPRMQNIDSIFFNLENSKTICEGFRLDEPLTIPGQKTSGSTQPP